MRDRDGGVRGLGGAVSVAVSADGRVGLRGGPRGRFAGRVRARCEERQAALRRVASASATSGPPRSRSRPTADTCTRRASTPPRSRCTSAIPRPGRARAHRDRARRRRARARAHERGERRGEPGRRAAWSRRATARTRSSCSRAIPTRACSRRLATARAGIDAPVRLRRRSASRSRRAGRGLRGGGRPRLAASRSTSATAACARSPSTTTRAPTTIAEACAVAISPDGAHVYVAGYGHSAIALFRRGRDARLKVVGELPPRGARDRARVDPAARRLPARRAAVAARERRARARARRRRVHPVRQADRHARARRGDARVVRGPRLRRAARSTCAARASPRACCSTSTCRRSSEDGVEAIAWVAAQPWCSGAVGLIGKSWGGFNALQIAARRPPALRGIVTVCSTDDRYADDVHYMGGCLLNDNLWWGGVFFQLVRAAARPGARRLGLARACGRSGSRRRSRIRCAGCAHPLRDAYWRQGSVCEDYAAIECPVYAVGGWADAYTQRDPAPARGTLGAAPRPGRTLGPRLSARGRARSRDRLPPGRAALVGRAVCAASAPRARAPALPRLDARERAAPAPGRRPPGPLGRRGELALAAHRAARAPPRARSPRRAAVRPRGSRSARRRRPAAPRAAGSWRRCAISARTTPTRCASTRSRSRERIELLGAPELRLVVSSRSAGGVRGGAPVRRRARRRVDARQLRALEPHPRARSRGVGAARAGPRDARSAFRLNDVALRVSRPAIGCGSRSRTPTGRSSGPRRCPATLEVYTEECQLVLPIRPPDPADAAAARVRAAPRARPRSEWTPLGAAALRAALRGRRGARATS